MIYQLKVVFFPLRYVKQAEGISLFNYRFFIPCSKIKYSSRNPGKVILDLYFFLGPINEILWKNTILG